jgi:hypothetical protein
MLQRLLDPGEEIARRALAPGRVDEGERVAVADEQAVGGIAGAVRQDVPRGVQPDAVGQPRDLQIGGDLGAFCLGDNPCIGERDQKQRERTEPPRS